MPRRAASLTLILLLTPAALADPPSKQLQPPDRSVEQAIDHYLNERLASAGARPVPAADDATLLRRLTLDLAGRVPTLTESTEYLASTDPQRKGRLVDRLLASPGFVRHNAQEFATLLQGEERGRRGQKKSGLRDYLQRCFAENRPWDRMFRELLLPDDNDSKTQGAGDYLRGRVKDQDRLTVDVSTVFFGVNVSCAQCHDHPHVHAWSQDHYYGLKSFFARTVEAGGFLAERDFGVVKYIPNKGKEKVAPVMFLTGKTLDVPGRKEPGKEEKKREQDRIDSAKRSKKAPAPPQFSLRAKLVETALEPDQRHFFARAIVNRLWYRFHGRGLVMPLDQMHLENPPSHPELLDWLARDLVTHGYDLKRLMRGMVLSEGYARTSRRERDEAPPDNLFAVAQVRPLSPAQMAVSLRLATVDPESLPRDRAELEKRLEALEKSAEKFSSLFAQPGEKFQVGVSEAMLLANNEALLRELLDGPNTLVSRMRQIPDTGKRIDLAVRTALGRPATAEETAAMTEYMSRRQDRPDEACRQVVWALLASAEFRFNH